MKRAFVALAVVGLTPFALTFCAPHEAPVTAPIESESAVASSAPSAVVSSAPASSPSSVVADAPYKGKIPKDCAAIDRAAAASFNEGTCKVDSDCTTGNVWCSCYAPITKTAAAKLNALNSAFSSMDCYSKMPPRPCATCAPPPEVKCANGKCTTR